MWSCHPKQIYDNAWSVHNESQNAMRSSHAYLLFLGTLLTALGYGATFLLTEHFRSLGGSEINTGTTLAGAMVGTLIGVPLVGWFASRLGAARMAAFGAISVATGYLGLAFITVLSDRKSTRLNSSHVSQSRMPSSA